METTDKIVKPVVEIPVKEGTSKETDTDVKATIQEQIQRILEEPDGASQAKADPAVEAEALEQIRQILGGLDKEGPVRTAFAGCLGDAETNLAQGTCCSMEERNNSLAEEVEMLGLKADDLQKRLSKMTNELKLFSEQLSEEKQKNTVLESQLAESRDIRGVVVDRIKELDAQIVHISRGFLNKEGGEKAIPDLSMAFAKKDLLESVLNTRRAS
jgi:chromosome segregation ATPase